MGMSRTGSGKTLTYLIPVIQNIIQMRSAPEGTKALIICPNRELAAQILQVGKSLYRSVQNGADGVGKTPVSWALVVGGESMDNQFQALSEVPDM